MDWLSDLVEGETRSEWQAELLRTVTNGLLAFPPNTNLNGCSPQEPDIWQKLLMGGRQSFVRLQDTPRHLTYAAHEVLSCPSAFPAPRLPPLSITSEN